MLSLDMSQTMIMKNLNCQSNTEKENRQITFLINMLPLKAGHAFPLWNSKIVPQSTMPSFGKDLKVRTKGATAGVIDSPDLKQFFS